MRKHAQHSCHSQSLLWPNPASWPVRWVDLTICSGVPMPKIAAAALMFPTEQRSKMAQANSMSKLDEV